MFSTPRRGRAALVATAALVLGQLALAAPALAAPTTTGAPTLAAGTRFFTRRRTPARSGRSSTWAGSTGSATLR